MDKYRVCYCSLSDIIYTKLWRYCVSDVILDFYTYDMELIMNDVKDYTNDNSNTHYNGVQSTYGKRVAEQNRMQPKYCEPGVADGKMASSKRNEQAGP